MRQSKAAERIQNVLSKIRHMALCENSHMWKDDVVVSARTGCNGMQRLAQIHF
jgi:hypothetical protein